MKTSWAELATDEEINKELLFIDMEIFQLKNYKIKIQEAIDLKIQEKETFLEFLSQRTKQVGEDDRPK